MYKITELPAITRYRGKREALVHRVAIKDGKGCIYCTLERPTIRAATADAGKLLRVLNGTLF